MGLSSEDVPLLLLVVLYGARNLVLTIGISGHSSHEELPWLLAALKASERKDGALLLTGYQNGAEKDREEVL